MAEFVAATAAEMLEGVASIPAQAPGQSISEWLAEAQFQRVVQESQAGSPVYRWNFDPAAEEAFSKIVDETSADGAWQAWKESDGFVNPSGSAAPKPTVKASPQTAIKGAGGAATAGGLLSVSLPTWVAAAAPLIGVAVGTGLYELSPEFWEKVSRTLLPFCYEDSQAMPVVTDEDGNTYIDKEAADALKQLFEEEGLIGEEEISGGLLPDGVTLIKSGATVADTEWVSPSSYTTTCGYSSPNGTISYKVGQNGIGVVMASATPFSHFYKDGKANSDGTITFTESEATNYSEYTYDGRTVYYVSVGNSNGLSNGIRKTWHPANDLTGQTISDAAIAWSSIYGNISPAGEFPEGTAKWEGTQVDYDNLPTKEVFTSEDGSTTKDYIPVAMPTQPGQSVDHETNPDPTKNEDVDKQISPYILPSIPDSQYPDGSDSTGDEDQTLDKNAPIPTPIPNQNPKPDPKADPSKPSDQPPQKIIDIIPGSNIGDIGDLIPTPSNPTVPGASGSDGGVGGLVSVYNPTYAELQAFSQWLWVTYADATIDKIWNNPFDGIISLHEFYADPDIGGKKYIKSGFLVSPVECNTVPNRYTEINCGSAIVPEHYGNYLDYSPYSKALVYLPFIGIEELNVDDIVGHAINITYHVDSYSGACIALISCAKEGSEAVFYQFCGNCSVQLPIAGGTQAAIKAAQLSAGAYQNAYHVAGVSGLAGGIASGIGSLLSGNIGGLLGNAVNGIGSYMTNQAQGQANAVSQTVSAKSSVQHSGQFGESFGAMGAKTPYLIVKRPIQVQVPNYQAEYGYPAHKYVTIGECEGFLRCRGVHVASARATDEERQLIEKSLTEGVFVT